MYIFCTGGVQKLPVECFTWNMLQRESILPTLKTDGAASVFACRCQRDDNTHESPSGKQHLSLGLSCLENAAMDDLELKEFCLVAEHEGGVQIYDEPDGHTRAVRHLTQKQAIELATWLNAWITEKMGED